MSHKDAEDSVKKLTTHQSEVGMVYGLDYDGI